jgi:hypothetical protein
MKQKLIPIILSVTLAVLCTVSIVDAQAGLPPLTAYTQNFDSLANSGKSSALPLVGHLVNLEPMPTQCILPEPEVAMPVILIVSAFWWH